MITAVLFDFGNVLYWFDYDRFFNAVAPYSPFAPAQLCELFFDGADPVSHQYETGRMSTRDFLDWLRAVAQIERSEEELRNAFVDIYTENRPVTKLVDCLADQMPVGLVSNTNEMHYEHFMSKAPIHSRFTAVGTSFQAGAMKPAAPIFHIVLAQLLCRPEQCVFIDDLEDNVRAARSLGMYGIHYRPDTDLPEALRTCGVDVQC